MSDTELQIDLRLAMEDFFHAYKAFTAKPDEMLAKRGLARVHHRILFFVANAPGLSVKELLSALGVTKQAINMPLRQLVEMGLISTEAAEHDKRIKKLALTQEGLRLEEGLFKEQARLLMQSFGKTDAPHTQGWLAINKVMADKQ